MKIWAYGVGHFFNDLAGACWFNFLFFYLKRVVQTPAATTMFFVGQIVDGFATPTIGYFSDKFNTKYGKIYINI
jgi:Na+/melibiose symporter-like transporter